MLSLRSRIDAETISGRMLAYAVMVGLLLAAIATSVLLDRWISNSYIILLLAANSLSGWYCKRGPGLVSVVLATSAVDYFFLEPKFSFIVQLHLLPFLLLFAASGAAAVLWLTSERHAFQKAIVRNEENLRTLLDGIQDHSIILLSAEGKVVTWNSGAQRMQGYSSEEIIGKHISCFYPPAEAARAEEILAEAVRTGRVEQEGLRIRKDGSDFWANVVVTPLFEKNGKLKGFSKIKRDISQRKKTEAELEKQTIVTSIVESAPDAMVMVSEDATILLFNVEAEKLFGYRREEILGQSIETLVPIGKRQGHITHRSGFTTQPQTRAMGSGLELYAQRKDGSVVPVEVSLSPIRHFGRTFVISSIRDVSDRKRILKMATDLHVMDLAQVMVRELDGKIVHWTGGAERLYGYTREQAVGAVSHTLLQTVFPERLEHIEQQLRDTGHWEGELIHKKRDGGAIHVSSYWILHRDERDQPHLILESSTDITDLKEAERQVLELNTELAERNSKLQSANALIASQTEQIANAAKMSALGEMAGGIAHEINNPIGIIHARVNDLMELAEEGATVPSAAVIETMEKVSNLVMRVAKITKSMRRFSRDAHQDPFHMTSVGEILEDTLSFCQERFKLRSVALRLPQDASKLKLACRGTEIAQVFLNLLNNALDAIETLPEKWIEIEAKDLGNSIELSITDSGHGILPATREKLGQPFFTTKEIGKGTGLGLSISRGIVESHGGSLTLDVDCAHTRFLITLPKKPQLPTNIPKEPSFDSVSDVVS